MRYVFLISVPPPPLWQKVDPMPATITLPSELQASPTIREINLKGGQIVRQGDVLIRRMKALPTGAMRRTRRDLAIGIRFSHTAGTPAETWDVPGDPRIWITAPARWVLEHDQHACFVLPAGVYVSWRQQEISIESQQRRTVRD